MATTTVVLCEVCGRRNRVPSAAAAGTPHCGNCHAPLPWMAEADDSTFAEVVEGSEVPVLLDLWAPWCGPCRIVSPALERFARRYAGRVKLVKVNADEAAGTAQRFDVRGIPTLIVMNQGQVVARQTGAPPEQVLQEWLEQTLQSAEERYSQPSGTGRGTTT